MINGADINRGVTRYIGSIAATEYIAGDMGTKDVFVFEYNSTIYFCLAFHIVHEVALVIVYRVTFFIYECTAC